MTPAGQERQSAQAKRKSSDVRPRRLWRRVVPAAGAFVLALAGLVLALGLMLAARLAVAPMAAAWLLHLAGPVTLYDPVTHQPAARLAVGRLSLRWRLLRDGPEAPLQVEADEVAAVPLADGGTVPREHAGHVQVSLDFGALLVGRVAPQAVSVEQAALTLRRVGGRLVPALQTGSGDGGGSSSGVASLSRVTLRDVYVAMPPMAGDAAAGLDIASVSLWRDGMGLTSWRGSVDAGMRLAGQQLHLTAVGAAGSAREAGRLWRIAFDPIVPSLLPPQLPFGIRRPVPLAAIEAPVTVTATVHLVDVSSSAGIDLDAATLRLALGTGSIASTDRPTGAVQAGAVQAVAVQEGMAQLSLRRQGARLALGLDAARLAVLPASGATPTVFVLHGDGAARVPAGPPLLSLRADALRDLSASLIVDVDRADFATLARIWPPGLARNPRKWIIGNMTAGIARHGHVVVGLGGSSLQTLEATSLSGGLEAEDVTAHWLRPIPPLIHARAQLALLGPDALRVSVADAIEPVTLPDGTPSVLRLPRGSIDIDGLSARHQIGTIHAHLEGGLAATLALLAHPRLKLLSRTPFAVKDPAGQVALDLSLVLPLDDKVDASQLKIVADAALSQVHLGDVAAGRALNEADLRLHATQDGMTIAGTATVAQLPTRLRFDMDFRDGPPEQQVEHAVVDAQADGAAITRAAQQTGLDAVFGSAPVAGASAPLHADYAERRDGSATLALEADLGDVPLTLPLGWHKPRGVATEVRAALLLDHGHLAGVRSVQAHGPALALEAHGAVEDRRATAMILDRLELGRSRAEGEVLFPEQSGGTITAELHAQALDLVPLLHPAPAVKEAHPSAEAARREAAQGRPWAADARIDRVLLDHGKALTGVRAQLRKDGAGYHDGRLTVAGPIPALFTLAPDGPSGRRRISGRVSDFGGLLSAFSATDAVRGGTFTLEATAQDPRFDGPVDGVARLAGAVLPNAPKAARLARDMSVYGLLTGLPNPQLAVGQVVAPFRYQSEALDLTDVRAFNAALGATLRGRIDIAAGRCDLRGTVVPAYLFNALPGKLPLIGKLFSPEKGGGMLAVTIRLRGPLDNPSVTANPLSILAPGALRPLLFR